MRSVRLAVALAAVGLLAWGSRAAASDTVPLVLTKPAGDSDFASDDDNHLAHFRYRAGFHYGHRHFGHYGYGYSYRPLAYSYYRPYYAYSYRPFYGYGYGYGYGYPYYSSYYYPSYYRSFSLSIGVGPSCYYYPIAMTLPSTILDLDCPDSLPGLSGGSYGPGTPVEPAKPSAPEGTPEPSTPAPPMPKPEEEGTFPYDGGPMTPAPMPQAEPAPGKTTPATPRIEVPPSGRLVSHTAEPAPKSKWVYPAYGEKPRRTSFATDR